jgi:hypothetical protein
MFIKYTLFNTITGQGAIAGYIDTGEIASWNEMTLPDEGIQGFHRTTRGKKLCYVTLKSGVMNYTDENFHLLSVRILEARGQHALAVEESLAAEVEKANRKSPLSIS